MPTSRDMTLKILSCREAYRGRNKRGDEFIIHEIEAAKPDGTPIREKLRAFSSLPIGQLVDVSVTSYESEQYGRSFTLAVKGSKSGNFSQAINDLTEANEELTRRIATLFEANAALAQRVAVLESRNGGPPVTTPPAPTAGAQFGEEPPW